MEPLKPEHANKVEPVTGTEFEVERCLVGYAYPQHGNLHNPTPRYQWTRRLDGKIVDTDNSMRRLVEAARQPGAAAAYRE